nr:hypothetical protein [Candidatus Sigynarchaeota archaeon]
MLETGGLFNCSVNASYTDSKPLMDSPIRLKLEGESASYDYGIVPTNNQGIALFAGLTGPVQGSYNLTATYAGNQTTNPAKSSRQLYVRKVIPRLNITNPGNNISIADFVNVNVHVEDESTGLPIQGKLMDFFVFPVDDNPSDDDTLPDGLNSIGYGSPVDIGAGSFSLYTDEYGNCTSNGFYLPFPGTYLIMVYCNATGLHEGGHSDKLVNVLPVLNSGPVISLESPSPNSELYGLVSFHIQANDYDTRVVLVEVDVKHVLDSSWTRLGARMDSPWIFSWDTTLFLDGEWQIRIRAYDTDNWTTQYTCRMIVNNIPDISDDVPPLITILHPASVSSIFGNASIDVLVSDNESSFRNGSIYFQPFGVVTWIYACSFTSPSFTHVFDTTCYPDGIFTIKVVAQDYAGNTATQSIWVGITNFEDSEKPQLEILSPADYQVVTDTVDIFIYARDWPLVGCSGLNKISVFALGKGESLYTLIGNFTGGPTFHVAWDTTTKLDGVAMIMVVAWDMNGNWEDDYLMVVVDNVDSDDFLPPYVRYLDPAPDTVVGGILGIAIVAIDRESKIAMVNVEAQDSGAGYHVLGSMTHSRDDIYTMLINVSTWPNGELLVYIKGFDVNGNQDSTIRRFYIDNSLSGLYGNRSDLIVADGAYRVIQGNYNQTGDVVVNGTLEIRDSQFTIWNYLPYQYSISMHGTGKLVITNSTLIFKRLLGLELFGSTTLTLQNVNISGTYLKSWDSSAVEIDQSILSATEIFFMGASFSLLNSHVTAPEIIIAVNYGIRLVNAQITQYGYNGRIGYNGSYVSTAFVPSCDGTPGQDGQNMVVTLSAKEIAVDSSIFDISAGNGGAGGFGGGYRAGTFDFGATGGTGGAGGNITLQFLDFTTLEIHGSNISAITGTGGAGGVPGTAGGNGNGGIGGKGGLGGLSNASFQGVHVDFKNAVLNLSCGNAGTAGSRFDFSSSQGGSGGKGNDNILNLALTGTMIWDNATVILVAGNGSGGGDGGYQSTNFPGDLGGLGGNGGNVFCTILAANNNVSLLHSEIRATAGIGGNGGNGGGNSANTMSGGVGGNGGTGGQIKVLFSNIRKFLCDDCRIEGISGAGSDGGRGGIGQEPGTSGIGGNGGIGNLTLCLASDIEIENSVIGISGNRGGSGARGNQDTVGSPPEGAAGGSGGEGGVGFLNIECSNILIANDSIIQVTGGHGGNGGAGYSSSADPYRGGIGGDGKIGANAVNSMAGRIISFQNTSMLFKGGLGGFGGDGGNGGGGSAQSHGRRPGYGANGGNIISTINSSESILGNKVNITLEAGAGGSNNGPGSGYYTDDSVPGGEGGYCITQLIATSIALNLSSISGKGGTGATGSPCVQATYDAGKGANGRLGGKSGVSIFASSLNLSNSNVSSYAGNSGNGGDAGDSYNTNGYGDQGGYGANGADSDVLFNFTSGEFVNCNISSVGGNAGRAGNSLPYHQYHGRPGGTGGIGNVTINSPGTLSFLSSRIGALGGTGGAGGAGSDSESQSGNGGNGGNGGICSVLVNVTNEITSTSSSYLVIGGSGGTGGQSGIGAQNSGTVGGGTGGAGGNGVIGELIFLSSRASFENDDILAIGGSGGTGGRGGLGSAQNGGPGGAGGAGYKGVCLINTTAAIDIINTRINVTGGSGGAGGNGGSSSMGSGTAGATGGIGGSGSEGLLVLDASTTISLMHSNVSVYGGNGGLGGSGGNGHNNAGNGGNGGIGGNGTVNYYSDEMNAGTVQQHVEAGDGNKGGNAGGTSHFGGNGGRGGRGGFVNVDISLTFAFFIALDIILTSGNGGNGGNGSTGSSANGVGGAGENSGSIIIHTHLVSFVFEFTDIISTLGIPGTGGSPSGTNGVFGLKNWRLDGTGIATNCTLDPVFPTSGTYTLKKSFFMSLWTLNLNGDPIGSANVSLHTSTHQLLNKQASQTSGFLPLKVITQIKTELALSNYTNFIVNATYLDLVSNQVSFTYSASQVLVVILNGTITGTTSVFLNWTCYSSINPLIGDYSNISFDGGPFARVNATSGTFTISGGVHVFEVDLFDVSNVLVGTINGKVIIDHDPPTVPTIIAPVNNFNSTSPLVVIQWLASTDSISFVSNYSVFINGSWYVNTTSLSTTMQFMPGSYNISVLATDAVGNARGSSIILYVDLHGPSPFTLDFNNTYVNAKDMLLTWMAAPDDLEIIYYNLTLDNTTIASVPSTQYLWLDVTEGVHTALITAFDRCSRNISEYGRFYVDRTNFSISYFAYPPERIYTSNYSSAIDCRLTLLDSGVLKSPVLVACFQERINNGSIVNRPIFEQGTLDFRYTIDLALYNCSEMVEWRLYIADKASNIFATEWHNFTVIDDLVPELSAIYISGTDFNYTNDITVSVFSSENDYESGLKNVTLVYLLANGTSATTTMVTLDGELYNYTIPNTRLCSGPLYVDVKSYDNTGNIGYTAPMIIQVHDRVQPVIISTNMTNTTLSYARPVSINYSLGEDPRGSGIYAAFINISRVDDPSINFSRSLNLNRSAIENGSIEFLPGFIPLEPNHTYSVFLYCTDGSGNVAKTTNYTWMVIDDIAPDITLLLPGNMSFMRTISPIYLSIDDASRLDVQARWDTEPFTAVISNETDWYYPIDNLACSSFNGLHLLHVNATDALGNKLSKVFTFVIDNAPPTTSITFLSAYPGNWVTRNTTFTLASIDNLYGIGVADVRYRINQSAWQSFTSSFNITLYASGNLIIEYYGIDQLNNTEMIKNSSVFLDGTPPATLISFTPSHGTYFVNESTSFLLMATEGFGEVGVAHVHYRVNGGPWIEYTAPFNLSLLPSGIVQIDYYSIDNVGNEEKIEMQFVQLEYSHDGQLTWLIDLVTNWDWLIIAVVGAGITIWIMQKYRRLLKKQQLDSTKKPPYPAKKSLDESITRKKYIGTDLDAELDRKQAIIEKQTKDLAEKDKAIDELKRRLGVV